MTRHRHFQITYCFKKQRHLFVQPDSHLTDEDAWYYACLHAGVDLLYGEIQPEHPEAHLREHAEKSGLTSVKWEELP